MKFPRLFAALLLGALPLFNAAGQPLPISINPTKARDNFQSFKGVPISDTLNVPPGSDGRAPGPVPGPLGTLNQFQSLNGLGGAVPERTTNASRVLVGLRTRAGASYIAMSARYDFGEVIPPPDTDEYGVSLGRANGARQPTTSSAYWLSQPYSTNNHAGAAYYWSPHAEKVYATQPGALTIRWLKASPSVPVGSPAGVSTVVIDSQTYTLLIVTEVVAAAPVKSPRRMYWTEGPFAQLGRPVNVPTDRIKDIKVIYNDQFPQFTPVVTNGTNRVRLEYPFDGTQVGPLAITNTLWFDRTLNTLRAYNYQDQRVFVEFLGDKRGQANNQDIHQQIGFEIVEVVQRPIAADVTAELGDLLTPFEGPSPGGTPQLFADAILNAGQSFVFRHSIDGTTEFEFFAIRETRNQNDYQMHWMEEGLQGLRWPYRYVRYAMVWPPDVAKYSHYLRPTVATEAEARATAVALPAQNAPQIAYQDQLDEPRGKLTDNFAYYSWLNAQYPAHRALIQFTSGKHVRFERIFSWLDGSLRDNPPPPPISDPSYPQYTNAFTAATTNATTYGSAFILNGRLILTRDLPDLSGAYVLNDFPPNDGVVESFKATFLVRMSATNVPPADGFSFNFGTLPNPTNAFGEEGISDGISVTFDHFDSGPGDFAPGIQIKADGETKAAVSMGPSGSINPGILPQPTDPVTGQPMVLPTGLAFVPVVIELSVGGVMDVSFKGVKVLENIATGYKPRAGRFGFLARTGGFSSTHEIDNLAMVLNLPPVTKSFATDFGSTSGGAVAGGSAYVNGGFLHLTDALNSQNASYVINDFTVGGNSPVESFSATFKASLRDSTCCGGNPADGFSFNFGSLPNGPIANGEDGTDDGLVVSFDLWDSGPGDYAPGIEIRYNGVHRAGVRMAEPGFGNDNPGILPIPMDPATGLPMTLTTGPQFVPVRIDLRADGRMDVWYKGVKVLQDVVTGYTPRRGQFGLFARTGGANSTHWIDDLSIAINSSTFIHSPSLAGSVAANLSAWLPGARGFVWPDFAVRPRIVYPTAVVGQRLNAPPGEQGGGLDTNYLAGYIQASQGTSYHPGAYVDPFVHGFDLANHSAIIPVNAIPGQNVIEVWWFRKNQVDLTRGFRQVFWPSVIGRYTNAWPTSGSEIILASNDGSGGLPSLEATGTIYVQNDPALPGYNPNEEHALMQGGQAYALRDDLNLTATTVPAVLASPGATYSSDPFVLLEYTETDGKLAIRPFRVRREKREAGITFEFQKRAAQILQAPMPLPLLGVAFAPKLPGQPRKGLNDELVATIVSSSQRDPVQTNMWTLTTEDSHGFLPFYLLTLQNLSEPNPTPRFFYATNVNDNTLQGVFTTVRPGPLYPLGPNQTQVQSANAWRYSWIPGTFPYATAPALLVHRASAQSWPVVIQDMGSSTNFYIQLRFLSGLIPSPATNLSGLELVMSPTTTNNGALNDWRLGWNVLPRSDSNPEMQRLYANATFTDRKGNVWVYRGPHVPSVQETFSMRFYYNTLPGFFFPTLAPDAQPPAGTVTPYLRRRHISGGGFVGDAVYGNQDADQDDDKNALPIVYHPYWPADAPVLQMAETLTTTKRGLPAVRGQSSLQVLYQQSQTGVTNGALRINGDRTSVILHDPTRVKKVEFNQNDLPASVRTESSRGKIWFPNLPPHLVKRFWLDPNEGINGALIFSGEFVDAPLGDKYLLLNVAGAQDATTLRELCPSGLNDPDKIPWNNAINALATDMERFVENPAVPGTYIPHPIEPPLTIGLGDVAQVTDDDVAVDSYALTAIGPGTGHVTLIAGNGLAHTPEGEPVSMEVIRVVPNLYRGEVTVIESENPLNERLTLQQVVDLAGHAEDYTFDWRITAPVDGQPPLTYTRALWSTPPPAWFHVRFPLATDQAADIEATAPPRVVADISDAVVPVSELAFDSVTAEGNLFRFVLNPASVPHRLVPGNRLVMSSVDNVQVLATVHGLASAGNELVVSVDPNQTASLLATEIFRLSEHIVPNQPQSIAFSSFVVNPAQDNLTEVWLSLTLAEGLGAKVYLNGGLVVTTGLPSADANTSPNNPPSLLASPRLNSSFRLPASALAGAVDGPGGLKTNRLAVELFAPAVAGALLDFQVRVEAIKSIDQVVAGTVWIPLDAAQYQDGVRAVIGGTADVRSLSDNYLTMRYRPNGNPTGWSQWTEPQLAEGWIKRVLKGINPFNQRITDLYNNAVNTDVSVISQAGQRWEGNIALNLESMNSYGLIEIYETVLNRGRDLSINADINYGPANDALLLAVGYINDLYMLVGNEAAADAANPTIGIGTANHTYSDIATALFSFKGQLPSLLAEELGLLRGRDDFLVPGVDTRPVYNRMVWNYTRGIDAGEVIYALNYNILDQNTDGKVDANDALKLFPQGHGDAYGHYLTAVKGYYHLLLNPNFDWVPRGEAVLVLGKPVSVDYQDERKFAAAAGALARTGRQIFDLAWRQDFRSGKGQGWAHFRNTKTSQKGRTRHWGLDHWASRTAQGAYVNWIVGNAILPYQDPDPAHADTIQQVDRTTVPELKELPSVLESLQVAMDNAESGLTPIGLPEDSVPFDLNPVGVTAGEGNTHFEQIYTRAKGALQNAVVAFDDAKDSTRLMRSEQDSLADLRAVVDKQELAYTNALIELFGTPYPEDIGPGRSYRTGFAGPDLVHFMYVDNVELNFNGLLDPASDVTWKIDTQTFTANWLDKNGISDFNFIQPARNGAVDGTAPLEEWATNTTLFVEYNLAAHGFFKKPGTWVGRRASPGRIQQAISDIAKARNAAFSAFYWADAAKYDLDWEIQSLQRKVKSHKEILAIEEALLIASTATEAAVTAAEIVEKVLSSKKTVIPELSEAIIEAMPQSLVMGLASGGDLTSTARGWLKANGLAAKTVFETEEIALFSAIKALELADKTAREFTEFYEIHPEVWYQELRNAMGGIRDKVYGMNNTFMTINARLQELDDARRKYRALLAEGDRIQAEREIFRNRTAAVIQGYRTRDAAFRIFRNEKLERYKSLFDLAAQYTFMAAKAYDYETGLLGTDRGREFINRIVNSRALGVVRNGQPQFAGSNNGDPGLSSVLAEMAGDWSVVKSRLGFNNPDAYGTTASLRYENFRIITNEVTWKGVMNAARKANLLDDPDVRRYCLQIDDGTGLPVPGLVFEFGTTIGNGLNLFGHPLSPGDHKFSATAFATKIFAAGVALEGYVGMDDPAANSGAVSGSGGTSPPDPSLVFLDQNALSANPYIYLIPVGVDSMRSPPLGDTSDVRTWSVDDVAIPLPFNIGGSEYSSVRLWQSTDSLTEAPFTVRKHQAFRPVSSASVFSPDIYTGTGGLLRSQFTNNRLIGRSVWNSKWKIIIPGRELLSDPNEGVERFLRTVRDVKLHFVTYSYSGN